MTNNMSARGGKIIKIQFVVLLFGVIFAWTNFAIELNDWLNNRVCAAGCPVSGPTANPFLTPCFYGAVFFLVAFILSAILLKKSNEV